MTSPTRVVTGSRPSATTRLTRSRSLKTPTMAAPLRTAIAPMCDSAMMRAVSRTLTSGVTSGLSWVKRSNRIHKPSDRTALAYDAARQRQMSGSSTLRKIATTGHLGSSRCRLRRPRRFGGESDLPRLQRQVDGGLDGGPGDQSVHEVQEPSGKVGPRDSPGGSKAGASRREPRAGDDGFERVVVQQSFFALIERIFEMEEERAAKVVVLAQLRLRDLVGAPRAVKPRIRHGSVRERQVQLDDARGAAVPDRDLLIALRLPDLKRKVDERHQHSEAADEASQG